MRTPGYKKIEKYIMEDKYSPLFTLKLPLIYKLSFSILITHIYPRNKSRLKNEIRLELRIII